jgi:polysaccharide pyruvyl transferase WcaK-like protein
MALPLFVGKIKRLARQRINDLSAYWLLAQISKDQNPRIKTICHLGAWHGNMGDAVLLKSIQERLTKAAQAAGLELRFVPLNVQWTRVDSALVKKINAKCDLLLIGGGGLFLYKPESRSRSGWQLDITLKEIGEIDIPMVIYGMGYNQFALGGQEMPGIANEVLAALVDKAELFAARDEGSHKAFEERGARPGKILVIPDPAMWLKPEPVAIPGFNNEAINIGINLAADRLAWRYPAPATDNARAWTKILAQAVKQLIDGRGGAVYYIPHMLRTDAIYWDALKDVLGNKIFDIGVLLPQLFPPRLASAKKFVGVYSQMSAVIGMRGHANIIAFGTNVPILAVSSHNKNRFFMEQIGMDRYVVDTSVPPTPETQAHIASLLEELLDKKISIQEAYSAKRSELRLIADRFDRQVVEVLNR